METNHNKCYKEHSMKPEDILDSALDAKEAVDKSILNKHWSTIRPIPDPSQNSLDDELESLGITREQFAKTIAKYDDLRIQAMMFDMDIDIETWSLVPKSDYQEPDWMTRWRESRDEADFDERIDIDRE